MADQDQVNRQQDLNREFENYKSGLSEASEFVGLLTSRTSDLVDQYRNLTKASKQYGENEKQTVAALSQAAKIARSLESPYDNIKTLSKEIEKSLKVRTQLENSLNAAMGKASSAEKASVQQLLENRKKLTQERQKELAASSKLTEKQLQQVDALQDLKLAQKAAQTNLDALDDSGIDKRSKEYKDALKERQIAAAQFDRAQKDLLGTADNPTPDRAALQNYITQRNTTAELQDQLDLEEAKLSPQAKQILALEEALKAHEKTIEYQKEELRRLENIEKAQSYYNKTLGLTGDILDKVGAGRLKETLGINAGAEAAAEAAKRLTNNGQKSLKAFGKLRVLLAGIGGMLAEIGPKALFLRAISQMVDYFKTGDQLAKELSGEIMDISVALGVSEKNARELFNTASKISSSLGVMPEVLAKQVVELNEAFGTTQKFSENTVKAFGKLVNLQGLSTEEASNLVKISQLQGQEVGNQVDQYQAEVVALNHVHGTALSVKKVTQDIANTSAATILTLRGQGKSLGDAAFQANRLGLSMEKLENISGSLLDFESSIAKEMEAELLLGRDLNLNRAREAALRGDMPGLAAALADEMGSAAEFGELLPLQQEALAEALGMTRDSLAEALQSQELLANTDFKNISDASKQFMALIDQGLSVEQAQAEFIKNGGTAALAASISYEKSEEIRQRRRENDQAAMAREFLNVAKAFRDLRDDLIDLGTRFYKIFLDRNTGVITRITGGVAGIGDSFIDIVDGPIMSLGEGINKFANRVIDFYERYGPDLKSLFLTISEFAMTAAQFAIEFVTEFAGLNDDFDNANGQFKLGKETLAGWNESIKGAIDYIRDLDVKAISDSIHASISQVMNLIENPTLQKFLRAVGIGAVIKTTYDFMLGKSPLTPMFVKVVGGLGTGLRNTFTGANGGFAGGTSLGRFGSRVAMGLNPNMGRPVDAMGRTLVQQGGRFRVAAGQAGAGQFASVAGRTATTGTALAGLGAAAGTLAAAGFVAKGAYDVAQLDARSTKGESAKAIGGLGGAAGGAALGAAIGTMILPGVGTAIGAGIGAGVGYFGGRAAGAMEKFEDDLDKARKSLEKSSAQREALSQLRKAESELRLVESITGLENKFKTLANEAGEEVNGALELTGSELQNFAQGLLTSGQITTEQYQGAVSGIISSSDLLEIAIDNQKTKFAELEKSTQAVIDKQIELAQREADDLFGPKHVLEAQMNAINTLLDDGDLKVEVLSDEQQTAISNYVENLENSNFEGKSGQLVTGYLKALDISQDETSTDEEKSAAAKKIRILERNYNFKAEEAQELLQNTMNLIQGATGVNLDEEVLREAAFASLGDEDRLGYEAFETALSEGRAMIGTGLQAVQKDIETNLKRNQAHTQAVAANAEQMARVTSNINTQLDRLYETFSAQEDEANANNLINTILDFETEGGESLQTLLGNNVETIRGFAEGGLDMDELSAIQHFITELGDLSKIDYKSLTTLFNQFEVAEDGVIPSRSIQRVADAASISNKGPFTIQDSAGNLAITHPNDKLVVSPNVSYINDGVLPGRKQNVFPVSEKFGALDVQVGKKGVMVQKVSDAMTGAEILDKYPEASSTYVWNDENIQYINRTKSLASLANSSRLFNDLDDAGILGLTSHSGYAGGASFAGGFNRFRSLIRTYIRQAIGGDEQALDYIVDPYQPNIIRNLIKNYGPIAPESYNNLVFYPDDVADPQNPNKAAYNKGYRGIDRTVISDPIASQVVEDALSPTEIIKQYPADSYVWNEDNLLKISKKGSLASPANIQSLFNHLDDANILGLSSTSGYSGGLNFAGGFNRFRNQIREYLGLAIQGDRQALDYVIDPYQPERARAALLNFTPRYPDGAPLFFPDDVADPQNPNKASYDKGYRGFDIKQVSDIQNVEDALSPTAVLKQYPADSYVWNEDNLLKINKRGSLATPANVQSLFNHLDDADVLGLSSKSGYNGEEQFGGITRFRAAVREYLGQAIQGDRQALDYVIDPYKPEKARAALLNFTPRYPDGAPLFFPDDVQTPTEPNKAAWNKGYRGFDIKQISDVQNVEDGIIFNYTGGVERQQIQDKIKDIELSFKKDLEKDSIENLVFFHERISGEKLNKRKLKKSFLDSEAKKLIPLSKDLSYNDRDDFLTKGYNRAEIDAVLELRSVLKHEYSKLLKQEKKQEKKQERIDKKAQRKANKSSLSTELIPTAKSFVTSEAIPTQLLPSQEIKPVIDSEALEVLQEQIEAKAIFHKLLLENIPQTQREIEELTLRRGYTQAPTHEEVYEEGKLLKYKMQDVGRNTLVRDIQTTLKDTYSLDEGFVDGFYGGGSRRYLKQYQTSQGLSSDGIVGGRTYRALFTPNEFTEYLASNPEIIRSRVTAQPEVTPQSQTTRPTPLSETPDFMLSPQGQAEKSALTYIEDGFFGELFETSKEYYNLVTEFGVDLARSVAEFISSPKEWLETALGELGGKLTTTVSQMFTAAPIKEGALTLSKNAVSRAPYIGALIEGLIGGSQGYSAIQEYKDNPQSPPVSELYQELGKIGYETIGGMGGSILGGIALTPFLGPAGTIAGSFVGSILGEILGGVLADKFGSEGLGKILVNTFTSSPQKVEDGSALASKGPFTITDRFGATAVTAKGDGVVVSPNISYVEDGITNATAMDVSPNTTVIENDNSELKQELTEMKQAITQLVQTIPSLANREIVMEFDGVKVAQMMGQNGYRG